MLNHDRQTVSIVVPVYNEECVLPAVLDRLRALEASAPEYAFECILVDDGSADSSGAIIDTAAQMNAITALRLSRNFGHQAAVTAGIDHAFGDYVAVIDGDLQDPPELIPEMITAMKAANADVAYGVRTQRKENVLKRSAYHAFYRLLSALSPLEIPLDSGDFGVLSRRVADVLRQMPEKSRFIRGLRAYAGFKQIPFAYERHARAGGEPKYTLRKLMSLAMDGIVNFSEVPLRLATFVGFVMATLSLLYGCFILMWRLFSASAIPGFATLAVGLFFLGGLQLFCIGVLGEYVGRTHREAKNRPAYVVNSLIRRRTDSAPEPRSSEGAP